MRFLPLVLAALLGGSGLATSAPGAHAADPRAADVRMAAAGAVDVALVLVDDVSRSIDDSEFVLQKDGYAAAFTDPKVISAISGGANGAIVVSYIEFADEDQVRTVIDWTVIRDENSARAFVEALKAAPRSVAGRTAISAGIDHAVQMLTETAFTTERRVIDVCGDGTNNDGRSVDAARDGAVAAGITLNGLAIINDHPFSMIYAHVQPPGGLAKYYREHVTGGIGSFVVEIHEFHTFAEAMTRKLLSEIAANQAPARRL
jgi:hypothetical protein